MERTAPKLDEDPQDTTNDPKTKTQNSYLKKMKNYREAVVAWKSTGHGRASRFVYVTLDSPRKRTGDVNLQAPRASYSSR